MDTQLLKEYSNYLELMGHRVVQTSSTLWIDVRPRIFQPAPPFGLPTLDRDEIRSVMHKSNAIACRWFREAAASELSGTDSSLTVYVARAPYDISRLPHSARHQTRRGLERVEVRKHVLDEELIDSAFTVYSDTVKRLRLFSTEQQLLTKWRTWVRAIQQSDALQFWAAWHAAEMVAFAVTIETPCGTEFVLTRSRHSALSLYPNNALIYTITKDALDRGAPLVSLGLSAYGGEKKGLRHFKMNMGYEAVPLKENYFWHPIIRPFGALLDPANLRSLYRYVSSSGAA